MATIVKLLFWETNDFNFDICLINSSGNLILLSGQKLHMDMIHTKDAIAIGKCFGTESAVKKVIFPCRFSFDVLRVITVMFKCFLLFQLSYLMVSKMVSIPHFSFLVW